MKIKKYIPVTHHKFDKALQQYEQDREELLKIIAEQQKMIKESVRLIRNHHENASIKLQAIDERLLQYAVNLDKKMVYLNDKTINKLDVLNNAVQGIADNENEIKDEIKDKMDLIRRKADENIWATTWHDIIKESQWLSDQMFAPGRWAVGYQYLYVLYRVLNEFNPNSILELGLGQSTKMISQYVEYSKETRHIVVEHDIEWEQFYKNKNSICDRTTIEHLDLGKEQFNDDKEVIVYKDFKNTFQNEKFDFISIDAPFGGEAIKYARIDILKIIPQCLEDRFVIMVDDYNRSGEKEMVQELCRILHENSVEYHCGLYSGAKDCFIIVSKNYKFLCSM